MYSDPSLAASAAELREVVEMLLEQRIGAVPVVDADGKITGIISYVDLLRTYAGELPAPKPKAKPKAKAKPVTKKKAPSKKKHSRRA